MKHTSPGELHAYLDAEVSAEAAAAIEAHIQTCDACARALEQAIDDRATASRIVEAALEAEVSPPAWQALVARANSEASEATPSSDASRAAPSQVSRLAWAATIALAFLLGWQASDVWRAPGTLRPRGQSQAAAADAEIAAPTPGDQSDVPLVDEPDSPTEAAGAVESRAARVTGDAAAPTAPTEPPAAPPTETASTTEAFMRVAPPERDPWAQMEQEQAAEAPSALRRLRQQDELEEDAELWTYDGAEVTDMGESGTTPLYYDFDAFEDASAEADPAEAAGLLGADLIELRDADRIRVVTGLPALPGIATSASVGQLYRTRAGALVWVIEHRVERNLAASHGADAILEADGYLQLVTRRADQPILIEIRADATEPELRSLRERLREPDA